MVLLLSLTKKRSAKVFAMTATLGFVFYFDFWWEGWRDFLKVYAAWCAVCRHTAEAVLFRDEDIQF